MRPNTHKQVWPALLLALLCAGAKAQAQDYSPYVYAVTNTPNLLGYWRFDTNFLLNSYVNGYTGTNIADAVIGGPGSGCPLAGDPANQGLSLEGTNYIETDLVGKITNQFTLMCWMNIAAYPGTGGYDGYYEIIDQQANADDCDLILFPTGQVYLYTDAGGGDEVNTPNGLPLNEWHFIAGTMTNHGPRCIYVDGQLVAANTAGTHSVNSTAAFYIGYGPVFTPRHFVGSIDEAAIFNRALSASEIVSLYLASGPTNIGTLQGISLNISSVMSVGSLQASVTALYSAGTNFDVTGLASYASSDTNILTVTSNGLVTALQLGSATLTATYNGFGATNHVSVVPPTALLTHRYSFFNGTTNDLVGTNNTTLQGDATVSGGALNLDGNASATLPAGTIDSTYAALTIEMWANIQRTPNGSINVISSFGNPAGAYVRLGTHNSSGSGNAFIDTYNGSTDTIGWKPGPVVGNVHLVAVWNPLAGTMEFYENGYPANGNNSSSSLGAIASAHDLTNIIGADINGLNGTVGTIQEYRIYNGALSLAQIRTSLAAGPTNAPLSTNQITAGPITNVTVTTYPNFIVGTIQDPVVLASSATVQNINLTTLTNVTFTSSKTNVLMVLTNNRVQAVGVGTATLTATYLGVSGHTTVSTVAAQPLVLTHDYHFVSDASDSISGENGTLMGNATASSGLVLNSEGDGQGYGDYLALPRDVLGGYPALSVEMWVNLGTQVGNYCRLFSFSTWTFGGGGDQAGILLSPHYPGPTLTLIVNPAVGVVANDEMDLPADSVTANILLQNAGLVQVVAVLDPVNQQIASLYYNGQFAGVRQFDHPLTQVEVEHGLIGKSASVNDPFLVGTINELRIYYGAMTVGQIASNYFAVTNANNNTAIVAVNTGVAQITDPPLPQTVLAGAPVTFSVGAIGALPLSYQWFVGTNAIPGATAALYTIPSASAAGAGLYSVQVSNSLSLGSPAVSPAAQLTVDSAASLTNGLLLHLTFDGNYTDVTGNGYDGQAGGAPTFITGKIGSGAIHVNTGGGAFNYVSVPTSTGISYAGDFTVSFWQRHTGLPNDLPMVGNAVNSTYQPGWVLTDDLGQQEASLNGGGFIIFDPANGSPLINDGQWHHAALVVNRELEQTVVYVDGRQVAFQSLDSLGDVLLGDLSGPINNTLTIGQDPTGTYGAAGEYDIDDLAIWNRALSSGDLEAVYTLGQAGQSIINGFVPEMLTVQRIANGLQLNWISGILQSAPTVSGPWAAVPGATAPSYQYMPSGTTNQFFRVQLSGGTLP